jgi:fumarate hydratase class I
MAKRLTLPADDQAIRDLRAGDEVIVAGRLLTGREPAHRHLLRVADPVVRAWAAGTLIYHCGPVVACDPATGIRRFVAAGPSSSSSCEPYAADVIARYGLRGLLGKGGMGPRTLQALHRHGAVYLHAGAGLAVTLARHVTRVVDVHGLDELGVAEAIWLVEVEGFPATVTMDAHGQSLHSRSEEQGGEEVLRG